MRKKQPTHRHRIQWSACLIIVSLFVMMLSDIGVVSGAPVSETPVAKTTEETEVTPDNTPLDGEEDGSVEQHNLFQFEAFIKYENILDGTEPFDKNNLPGNDDSPNNGIVRSFDSVTYPIKLTINPKRVDKLENIKLRLTGTIDNGITDGRANAAFAIGGYENMETEEVGFTQEYTVKQTGNSVMIPVTMNVLGATPGVVLTPTLKIEVVSVDGEEIKGVTTTFDALPSVTVSAKVSLYSYTGRGINGLGIPYYPLAGIFEDSGAEAPEGEARNVNGFSIAWDIDFLEGKSDARGATFPDPKGKINYEVELYGEVDWYEDGEDDPTDTVMFNFNDKDSPFYLLDYQPITWNRSRVGSANTLAEGLSYEFSFPINYASARSSMDYWNPDDLEEDSPHSVWDSGEWALAKPKVQKHSVLYQGTTTGYTIGSTFPRYRADAWHDSPIYGVNDKVFATQGFLALMPNEYRLGGPNNKEGKSNIVTYYADVKLLNYTAPDGQVTTFNNVNTIAFAWEVNRPEGAYAVQTTLFSYPDTQQLGTPNNGWSEVSKGDASTLIGEDVYYHAALGSDMISYGGYKAVYRWNTDSFELTEEAAELAEINIRRSGYVTPLLEDVRYEDTEETMELLYGVAKFPKADNAFNIFTKKGIDDYTWYETYKEAAKHGVVGAIQSHVSDAVGAYWLYGVDIPLRVRGENTGLGSESHDGTPNIVLTNWYAYPTADRSIEVDVTENASYKRPAEWDKTGKLLRFQSPRGNAVNFETLGITPAESSVKTTSDKKTYYNSDTVHWTTESGIVLPTSGVPENLDAGVTITHYLPEGLSYKPGSGQVGKIPIEPQITKLEDGYVKLEWDALISNNTHSIPDITFDTVITPLALTSGTHSGVELETIISSDLDQRPEHLRAHYANITVLKVGMVGVYASIDKLYGSRNSAYTMTLSPYTTIEDEERVVGLTTLPKSGDTLGSTFSGSVKLKSINVESDRVYEDPVTIYLNKSMIQDDKPQNIDVTRNGWYKYTGKASELTGAQSLLFVVEGILTNRDDINVNITFQTNNNQFGDKYLNETVVNSATDYKLSPISNRLHYTIKADLELGLERIKIYTDKADKGLPVMVRVKQSILDANRVKDAPVKLVVYDTNANTKVAEKTYKQSELQRENELLIPSSTLTKNKKKNYEVRIEGIDNNMTWVRPGEGAIDTDGYTASEKALTEADRNNKGVIQYKRAVMTERELGKDIVPYYETLKIHKIDQPRVKSGYGFTFTPKVEYTNDLLKEVVHKIGIQTNTDTLLSLDTRLVDETLPYYQKDNPTSDIPLEKASVKNEATSSTISYDLPQLYLEQESGKMYTSQQKLEGQLQGKVIDAGHKWYVPIWLQALGKYDAAFKGKDAIGSNYIMFDVRNQVDVFAYMFHHTNSGTPDDDELLIHPMPQDDIPAEWKLP